MTRVDKYLSWLGVLVFLLSLPVNSLALGPDNEDDPDGIQPPAIDIQEILQVQVLEIPQLQGALVMDGVLDEPIWKQASQYEIKLETYPGLLDPSPVKTRVFVARIGDDLVVGFDALDPEPEKIQAPLRDRDSIEFDDYVGFSVDLSGKLVTRYEFYVTASGVQGDWVRNRIDDLRSRDWDADWESGARITEKGFTAEMRIPLSELDIPTGKLEKRFLMFKRHYPRAIRHHLNAVTTREVDASKKELKKKMAFIPSVTLLNEQSRKAGKGWDWKETYGSEIGLDFGYKFTPSLGMLVTYNPNYLEVETDLTDWSINDPFSKLVVEKRPFFLKGSETFATPFDLVYTRNIEDPEVGVKFAGIVSNLTTGNFYVNDEVLSLVVPGNLSSDRVDLDMYSQSGAFRYRYDFGPGKSIGAIATTRTTGSEYHNYVGGLDLYYRFNKDNELRAQWAYSDTDYPQEIVNELCGEDDACNDPDTVSGMPGQTPLTENVLRADPNRTYRDDALFLKYKYNQRKGYFIARYVDVGEDFRADMGYFNRVDYRILALSGGLNHYQKIENKGQIRFRPSLNFYRQESQAGELITESREIWLNHWGLYQSWIRLGYRNRERTAKRFLQDTLEIDGNSRYFTENQFEFRLDGATLKNLRFSLAGKIGTQIDTDNYRLGDLIEIQPEIRWNITDHLEFGLQDTYRQLDVEGGRLFTENYLGFHLIYHFVKGSFIRLTVIDDYVKKDPDLYLFDEEDALDRETTAEILFAWKPTQLNTLFVGAKFGAVDTDALDRPELEDMAFYIKYKRAFRF